MKRNEKAPRPLPRGSSKNDQLAGIANFDIYSLHQKFCQVFFLEFQKHTLQICEHLNKNVSLQTIVILAGGQL